MAALPTTDDTDDVTPVAAGTTATDGTDRTDGSAAGVTDRGGGRRWWPRPTTLRSLAPEIAVVAAALAMDLWNLSVNGDGNTYYAAAVRSMSESWHNFFYASVDPGGWITVDKPPLALWVQALSVRLFGFSSGSMLVPGALAVALVMWMVRRTWGRAPGLIAGLVLATTPVAVAVARSNNPDGMLVLLATAAAAALVRAVDSGRLAWLLGAAGLVAAAFLTKLLAALIVLPALWLAYLLFVRRPWRVRVVHLVAATGLLALLCAGWVLAVDHTSLSSRPWVGGSTNGSAADLVLGYNGIGRVTGAEQGPGGGGGGFPGGGGGPGGLAGPGGFGGGLDEDLLEWLRDQSDGERWLVAVGGVQQATAAIIDGDSVMPMGGFSGGDPAMTPVRLAELVRDGELRFVLTGGGLGEFGGPGGFGSGGIDTVVTTACTPVPASVAEGLYDCKGSADAITGAAETTMS